MSRSDHKGYNTHPNGDSADAQVVNHDLLEQFANLTAFQRDILRTLANEDDQEAYGLHIKRQLETLYGEEVNHGRLYPNLDTLVEADLIAKSALDKRTNNYSLTSTAGELLDSRQAWERGDSA
ncbi:PadR family transcriptional regulator [Halorubrum sp. AS12]|uniref:PadR family transcriptional regulator n=1 Tax=Halorubrum sp. AS12 TaxID=3409687 RepID=UPI003DA6E361